MLRAERTEFTTLLAETRNPRGRALALRSLRVCFSPSLSLSLSVSLFLSRSISLSLSLSQSLSLSLSESLSLSLSQSLSLSLSLTHSLTHSLSLQSSQPCHQNLLEPSGSYPTYGLGFRESQLSKLNLKLYINANSASFITSNPHPNQSIPKLGAAYTLNPKP